MDDATTTDDILSTVYSRSIDDTEAMIGKTIAGVAMTGGAYNMLVIGFADRTYAVIGRDAGWDGDYEIELDGGVPEPDVLLSAGVIDEDERRRIVAATEAREAREASHKREESVARELAEYERLRAKYGPRPSDEPGDGRAASAPPA